MMKRAVFASILLVLSFAPFACGGTDATIGPDAPDSATDDGTTGPDTTTSGPDTSAPDTSVTVDANRKDVITPKDTGTVDARPIPDGAVDAGLDAPPPYDGGPLNGCTPGQYTDRTNGNQVQRTITFPVGVIGNFQYSLPCMQIKVGQTVQFDGNFAGHPMEPLGGDVPTPITLLPL